MATRRLHWRAVGLLLRRVRLSAHCGGNRSLGRLRRAIPAPRHLTPFAEDRHVSIARHPPKRLSSIWDYIPVAACTAVSYLRERSGVVDGPPVECVCRSPEDVGDGGGHVGRLAHRRLPGV